VIRPNSDGFAQQGGMARSANRTLYPDRAKRLDPATADIDYTADEVEFANAIQNFKVRTGCRFPTNSDILRVLCTLGYHKGGSQ
jgi:hypothetical protein